MTNTEVEYKSIHVVYQNERDEVHHIPVDETETHQKRITCDCIPRAGIGTTPNPEDPAILDVVIHVGHRHTGDPHPINAKKEIPR